MPTAQKAKKTFSKKKAAPHKTVVKKAVRKTVAAVKAAPKKVQSTPRATQPIEKRISWLADNEATLAEKATPEPTLSEMPSTQPVEGEPVAPAITTSVGPEAHDTWPNPAVVATPDVTAAPVQPPTAPVTPAPVTQPVSPVETQPAVAPVAPTGTPPQQIQMAPPVDPAVIQPEPVASENVLGPNFDGASSQGGGKKKLLLLFIVVFLFVGLLTSGFFYYLSTQKGKLPNFAQLPTPTPKAMVEPTATPTAAAKVDLTKYTVKVLNGSGTAGEAGKASKLLEDTGFAGIDTGNADSYDYTDTEIKVGKDVPTAVFDAAKKSLGKIYSVVKSKDAPTDKYDIVVIVGSSDAPAASSSSAKTTKDDQ